jgi:hypothetical protein
MGLKDPSTQASSANTHCLWFSGYAGSCQKPPFSFFVFFIHMCIQCLGNFSPLPPLPPLPTPSFSPPPPRYPAETILPLIGRTKGKPPFFFFSAYQNQLYFYIFTMRNPKIKLRNIFLIEKNGTSKLQCNIYSAKVNQLSWKCSSVVKHLRRLHEVLGWSSQLHP